VELADAQRSGRPVAVVTGASAGVGRATAIALAKAGYDVGLVARGAAGLRAAADDVMAAGGRALAVEADVAEWADVRRAAQLVEDHLGAVEVWVNDAMTTIFAPVMDTEPEEIRRATEVTYLGQVHGAMAALELMRPRDRGVIVSVGSALAFRAIPLQAAYCGSKFAVRGFMQTLRTELLHDGSHVRVAMVHLPAVNTPQFGWCRSRLPGHPQPVPPIYQPEVAARAIVSAAKTGRRERIVGGWNWLVVQGNKVMPGVFDHYAARSAWSSQQNDDRQTGGREGNLDKPMDSDPGRDAGAHGSFGDRAHGMLDPQFLRSCGQIARDFAASVRDRARELASPMAG
jgi:NAD(P)-dependent dehydrogenase (short-subunit alcohol dehydrogenase family)